MGLRHPNLSIKDIIWLLNHDSIIAREVMGGVGDYFDQERRKFL
jgi:hypothetical protein